MTGKARGSRGRRGAGDGLLDLPFGELGEPERRSLDLFPEADAEEDLDDVDAEYAPAMAAAGHSADRPARRSDPAERDLSEDESELASDLADDLADDLAGDLAEGPITVSERLVAGGADVLVHAGLLAGVLIALTYLGAEPRLRYWPGLAGFLLCFSFLYVTLPLAFWGQTPGMVWSRLQARDQDDQPLTFTQTVLRWLAGITTVLLCGLPVLLALSGRSAADLLSRSHTRRAAGTL